MFSGRANCRLINMGNNNWQNVCFNSGGGNRVAVPGGFIHGRTAEQQQDIDTAANTADIFSDPVEWVKQNPLMAIAAVVTAYFVLK